MTFLTLLAISLVWVDNSTPDNPAATFNIYMDAAQAPMASVAAPALTFLLPTLTPGPHSFFVTAVNAQFQEGGHSNVFVLPGIPAAPTNLRVTP